jgi:hypothetical protein
MKKLTLLMPIFLTSVLFSCKESPEDVVLKFYRSVESGEISKAKECLARPLVDRFGDKIGESLARESEKIGKCGGIKDIQIDLQGKGEIRNGKATISFKGDCPENKTDKISLIQEDGEWKINLSK